jgi:hypothetical protein
MKAPIFTLLLLFSVTASADETFRCGRWIASVDMTVKDLKKKCGDPTTIKTEVQDIKAFNRDYGLMTNQGTTTIETWTYARPNQGKPMVVTIVDGHIKSMVRQE